MSLHKKHKALLLPGLAVLSGICGLSYQIIYARLIMAHFGSLTVVAVSILAAFLTGVAAGSLTAPKLARHIAWVEAAIGIYGLMLALLVTQGITLDASTTLIKAAGGIPPLYVAIIVPCLVALPAFCIGASLPLFSYWIDHFRQRQGVATTQDNTGTSHGFSLAYAAYNLGAALCLLLVELWIIRAYGPVVTLLSLTLTNLATAILLFIICRPATQLSPIDIIKPRVDQTTLVMAGIGLCEGMFTALSLTLSYQLLGGYPHVVAAVLAASFIGMTLGAIVIEVTKFKSILNWLILCLVVFFAQIALFNLTFSYWNDMARWIFHDLDMVYGWWLCLGVLIIALLPLYIVYGGIEPLLVNINMQSSISRGGEILFWSTIANAAGLIGGSFALIPWLGLSGLAAVISGISIALLICIFLMQGRYLQPRTLYYQGK